MNPLNIEELKETRLPLVNQCLIQKKEVEVNKEKQMMEQGPCNRTFEGKCAVYWDPNAKWRNGDCPMATHLIQQEDVKKFVNPIKASKRG